jgi:plasmid stabilization system protein ParE
VVFSVVFRHQADADIETIADDIARVNQGRAVAWAQALRTHSCPLGEFPECARIYALAIRRAVTGACLIF